MRAAFTTTVLVEPASVNRRRHARSLDETPPLATIAWALRRRGGFGVGRNRKADSVRGRVVFQTRKTRSAGASAFFQNGWNSPERSIIARRGLTWSPRRRQRRNRDGFRRSQDVRCSCDIQRRIAVTRSTACPTFDASATSNVGSASAADASGTLETRRPLDAPHAVSPVPPPDFPTSAPATPYPPPAVRNARKSRKNPQKNILTSAWADYFAVPASNATIPIRSSPHLRSPLFPPPAQ
jgi:hypothetical protein